MKALILLFSLFSVFSVFALQPAPIYSNDGCLVQLDTVQKVVTKGSAKCAKNYSAKFDAAIWLTAFTVQPDNKVVVALVNNKIDFVIQDGRPVRIVNSPIRLLRLNPNLTVDYSFGVNGYVFVSNMSNVTALTVQGNGNIIAAGGNMQLAIFSSSGKLNLYHKLNAYGIIYSLASTSDNNILIGGAINGGAGVVKFIPSKKDVDVSFSGGYVINKSGAAITAVKEKNGKIVTVGYAVNPKTYNRTIIVSRLLPSGLPDKSFNLTGSKEFAIGFSSSAYSATVLNDNRIYVAGYSTTSNLGSSFLSRIVLTNSGALDPSVPMNGKIDPKAVWNANGIVGVISIKDAEAHFVPVE